MLIDLFSGTGGLSLGFKMAGFNIGVSIEIHKRFVETYNYNNGETLCLNRDITKLNCDKVKNQFGKNKIKGIIGGPPCKGYSSVGNRNPNDPRNFLINHFIKWISFFKPEFFVMENVPGLLSMNKGKIVEQIEKSYQRIGYKYEIKELLAANYGVPQLRRRVFFIGSRSFDLEDLKIQKTHYESSKNTESSNKEVFLPYLNVRDAISDILDSEPFTRNSRNGLSKEYRNKPNTDYQKYLRKNSEYLYDHFAYPNIYGRLHLDKPADTITGNCGCVSAPGRFIHPTQDRAISVREAARLQSFPDDYRFFGNLNEKYKQVGNSVPPLMAFAIAKAIKKILN
jgi:DNA (cytosine-5)-methyltransferase 1